MNIITTVFTDPSSRRFKAALQMGSNGDNAKTAPVKIVARSGGAMNHWAWELPLYHDFSGMKHKNNIPIDYEHGEEIGYANKFDTSTGDLVLSGAIVIDATDPEDAGRKVGARASSGVPYEASIQWDNDYLMEVLEAGQVAQCNGQTVEGPAIIFREWTLLAVAICKLGSDSNTSTEVASSLAASKKSKTEKGIFLRVSKGNTMAKKDIEITETVEAVAEVTPEVAPEAVEVEVKTEETPKAETPAVEEIAEVIEPKDDAEAVAVEVPEEALVASKETETQVAVEAVDPRAEAKKFVATFGDQHGFKYFAEGMKFEDALLAHVKHQSEQLAELQKRNASQDRGVSAPLTFKDMGEKSASKSFVDVIKESRTKATKGS